jgi:hypothetical protein
VLLAGAILSASGAASGAADAVGLPRGGGAPGVGERLSLAYDDGSGETVHRTLWCGAEEGEGDDVEAACRRLAAVGGPLGPVPAGQMCTMLYGGPQTAHVTGSWHGRHVDERYRRDNGCEVARWNRMVPALPTPGAVPAPGPGAQAPGPGAVPGGSDGGVHALAP